MIIASLLSRFVNDQRFDAEILLAHVLKVNRAYLHTYPDNVLTLYHQNEFNTLMQKRLLGEPVAYLTGIQSFWSMELKVTPATLIPRPETELLVELALQQPGDIVADLGTGSGALALALAHEKPHWQIYAVDRSIEALKVAEENAKRLDITHVRFRQGNWCQGLPAILFDTIVSNPPYIAPNDKDLMPSVYGYEPHEALFSGMDGLSDLGEIIRTAKAYLKPEGMLLVEHGYQQASSVRDLFLSMGYRKIETKQDYAGLDRVTMGKK